MVYKIKKTDKKMVVRKSSRVKKSQKSLFRRSGSKKTVKKATKSRRISKKSNKKSVRKSNKKSVRKSNKKSVRKSVKKSNKKSNKKSVKKSNKNNDVLVKYDAAIMLYSTVRNKNANNTTYDIRYYVGAGKQVVVTNKWLESQKQYNNVRRDGPQYDAADIKQIKSWFGRLVKVLPIKQFKMVHVSDNVFNFSFVCSVKKQAEVVDTLTEYIFRVKTPVKAQDGQEYNVKVTPQTKIARVYAHQYTVVFGVGFESSQNNNNNSSNPTSPELDLYVRKHANSIKDLPTHMFNYETSPVEYVGGLGRLFRFTTGSNLSPKEVAHELKTVEPRGIFYYPTKDGKGELGYLTINLVAINGKEY